MTGLIILFLCLLRFSTSEIVYKECSVVHVLLCMGSFRLFLDFGPKGTSCSPIQVQVFQASSLPKMEMEAAAHYGFYEMF